MTDPEDFHLTTTELFEQALSQSDQQHYILRLYIAGATVQSGIALKNIKKICEEYLQGRYELEVIDIYQQIENVSHENIVAVPTLVKELPLPLQKIIGNLSNTDKVLTRLDLLPTKTRQGKGDAGFSEIS